MAGHSKIENFWYSKNPLRLLLIPLSLLVQIIALTKRFLYQINFFKINKNTIPVIVVGNITLGGTGKTPFISYLVQQFQAKGLAVGIVSRGYQSRLENYPHIIADGDTVIEIGDEAYMLYSNLKVPMAIGANRAETVEKLSQNFKLDLVISDDGLQHYSMARDFEILMIDSTRGFGNELMLPFGPLREPVSRVNSVDYIIQNGNGIKAIVAKLVDKQRLTKKTPSSIMNINVINCVNLLTQQKLPLIELNNYSICAVAGIGNPERFFASLGEYSDHFAKKVFGDHHAFEIKDFDGIDQELIIMTEKDAVKCQSFAKDNWYYLQVTAGLKDEEFDYLYELIKQKNIVK